MQRVTKYFRLVQEIHVLGWWMLKIKKCRTHKGLFHMKVLELHLQIEKFITSWRSKLGAPKFCKVL